MSKTATILCIKWGTVFSAAEVNLLFRACRANLDRPLRFVCLTDNEDGLDPEIESRPIPDIEQTPADWRRPGVWRKISLYHPDLHDLGRVLFIDLDMAIVGSLEKFFEPSQGVTYLNTGPSWRPVPRSAALEAGTGIFSFDPKEQAQILADYQADPTAAMDGFANEQDFAAAHSTTVNYWPEGWIISFKRHLCHRYGVGLIRKPAVPHPDAAVVAFHGHPRPSDTRTRLIWGVAPHWHLGRVPWIEDYYRDFGVEK